MPTSPSELLVPRDTPSSSGASLNSKADSSDSEAILDIPEKADSSTPQSFTMREQLVGFPYQQVLVLMAVRFAEPVTFTSLFPYVFFMVKHCSPRIPRPALLAMRVIFLEVSPYVKPSLVLYGVTFPIAMDASQRLSLVSWAPLSQCFGLVLRIAFGGRW